MERWIGARALGGGLLVSSALQLSAVACSGAANHARDPAIANTAGAVPAAGTLSVQPSAGRDAGSEPAGAEHATRKLGAPPSYLGIKGGGNECTTTYQSIGFEPVDGAGHPLFLYFVGTEFVSADASSKFDSQAALAVTEAMARRGFVALSVQYANTLDAILGNKLECLFGAGRADSLIAHACALPNVDCARGIATWGHSQGALLAHAAANYESRVKAAWTTGYGGIDKPALPPERLRVVNGEADAMNASVATLNKTAGFKGSECSDDGRDQCLRANGSGWIIVRKSQCRVTSADHCWFDKRSCAANDETLEPAWTEPDSPAAFGLEANADWLARTVLQP